LLHAGATGHELVSKDHTVTTKLASRLIATGLLAAGFTAVSALAGVLT
jgi:hypothetical protein